LSQINHRRTDLALWVLLLGNFVIGTGVLLPSGLLNDMARDFAVSPSDAGLLIFVGGIVVGFGAPLFATWTSAMDRRRLLTASLVLYAAGHMAAALAPSFTLQLILRAITVVAAAIFTPQAAATVGLMVPPERRAATIAFIFIGWSAASVAGIPLGALLSAQFGWRMVYAAMAVLSLFGAGMVWLTLSSGLRVQALGLSSWGKAFGTPMLLLVFITTLLSMAGQFSMFSYIAPLLRDGFGSTPRGISLAFAVVGAAGIAGNSLASRIVGRFGVDRIIAAGLISLAIGFVGFGLFYGNFAFAMLAAMFWGLGSFSSNSLQQSRLAALAPQIAAVTIALNTSFVYLGQSVGAAAGGRMIAAGQMPNLPWLSLAFMTAGLSTSLIATRLTRVA
jgi:MFS transporter, DHA1 family, inner membrane transport protein